MTGLPHPRFKYAGLLEEAFIAYDSAAVYYCDDNDTAGLAECARLNARSNTADIALIEFVVANYEDLMEAFK